MSTRPLALSTLGCAALLSLGGCALFPRNIDPPPSVFSEAGLQASAPGDAAATGPAQLMALLEGELLTAWRALATATAANEGTLGQTFLLKGISLVDARCDRYFHALGLAAQKQGFAQKELGLSGGLIGALQGLTGVAARDIAITTSGLGFLGASSDVYADAFIFSPEVSSVQALVAAAQGEAKARIAPLGPADFSRSMAINLLQDYEKTCEVHTIRRLVNESLSSARPVAQYSSEAPASLPLRLVTRDAVAGRLGLDAVTDDQLTALYWLTSAPPAAATELRALVQRLGAIPVLVDGASGSLKTDAPAMAARRDVARSLGTLALAGGGARLDADLAAMKQAAAAAAAPTPAPGIATAPLPGGAAPAPAATTAAARRSPFGPSLTIRVLPSR